MLALHDPAALLDAEFDPKVKAYWLYRPAIIFACTIILIPVAIIYVVIGSLFIQKYLDSMACALTERSLNIKQGLFNKVESTIPLEKITDLQMFQGPIMRLLGLHGFKVETAGQSAGPGGALVHMVGIKDTPGFRQAVLAQRDQLAEGGRTPARVTPSQLAADPASPPESVAILREIRDSLTRIESKLGDA
ncbi:MAG: PH domain-containing protein [Planctomycetota bacterium]